MDMQIFIGLTMLPAGKYKNKLIIRSVCDLSHFLTLLMGICIWFIFTIYYVQPYKKNPLY